ncbi:hypothetical protein E2A64_04085 [Pseudohoeflea suaedae]|uniref:Uncharacterized protein n=1 Tax=Pseudohoeflea suaedae TaxID=877384 RepID=A0A4R5PMR6_9HYPH|nr:hypothetical protein [Pseudohoeflea suaedae]MAZ83289.1 hypothetical protein [Hoeflea sp.]MBG21160.1 hypothetical protein [Hyphomicrobiales bacterium]TDH38302.1 hypothetical protein E2A64_04085 [Pseudohoeflea suaedae]|tara:strand:+ start:57056 stop:57295 length:240 start_codon:yes stop_codon:yes gene_type:complete
MTPQTRVKERAEEQSTSMSTDQQAAIRMVANDLHRLNHAVMKAVDAGVSVELVRSARHHGGEGNWGDLLIPVIVTQGRS